MLSTRRWPTLSCATLGSHLVGAVADGRLVGFVSAVDYWHPDKPRELWINEVGIAPDWRRRGVGTKLMQTTLDHARALGCFEAWVLTDHKNLAALALYRRAGGVQSGTDLVMFTFVFRLREAASASQSRPA
jgi:ribosomal protein S18 acetylase RimI-like enzyme